MLLTESNSISDQIKKLSAQLKLLSNLTSTAYNTPINTSTFIKRCDEIHALQHPYPPEALKNFITDVHQPLTHQLSIFINQHTTALKKTLSDIFADHLENKAYFDVDSLEALIERINWHHQHIKLYRDSVLIDNDAHQERVEGLFQALELIQMQFNSVALQSVQHWIAVLQEAIAEKPVPTLSTADKTALRNEINNLRRYQQCYQQLEHAGFWLPSESKRAQSIAEDINNAIQSIEQSSEKRAIVSINPVLHIANKTRSLLGFFAPPSTTLSTLQDGPHSQIRP